MTTNIIKMCNGTTYNYRTANEVVKVLEHARLNNERIHVSYGYTDENDVGLDWLEEYGVVGYVSRSCGPTKVPILVHNSRSLGGGAILDHRIVRIRSSKGGKLLYQHPNYHHGKIEVRSEPFVTPDGQTYAVSVLRDGKDHARFHSLANALRYVAKLGLEAEVSA